MDMDKPQGLTARQTQILKALIDEYVESAVPVGSEILEKKYNLGVSSATIRNEMATLTKIGYLKQPHTSAGRMPTPLAMRFYIDQLMEERHMSLADEVRAKEEVWDVRDDIDSLMHEAVVSLAQRTRNLAVGYVEENSKVWHAGYANIFESPEFSDLEVCADLFSLIEQTSRLREILFERVNEISNIGIVFGEELGWNTLGPVGVSVARVQVKGKNAAIGVVGPARLSPTVVPIVRYFGNLLREISR